MFRFWLLQTKAEESQKLWNKNHINIFYLFDLKMFMSLESASKELQKCEDKILIIHFLAKDISKMP